MVEFELQTWKKIVIHEVLKFPLQHFLFSHSRGVPEGGIGSPLTWADGFIFEKADIPETSETIKQKLEGKQHWTFLHYATVEEYHKEFKIVGNIRIPVVNVSENQAFKDMAKWIKENFEKHQTQDDTTTLKT